MIGAIVNAGKTAWDIIKDGRAVSTAQSAYCGAVPEKIPFTKLYGWKKKTGSWNVVYENLYGIDVIECELKYSFQYNGQCEAHPKSVFVTNFCVWAPKCDVAWGFTFDVNASTRGRPLNVGTKDKVIGAIPLLVRMSAGGANSKSQTMELTARGDGKLLTK